ncbi:MAG: autotransporter outer membrane beta-barrel domain-containing protein [Opitutaceae bacterium]|jgi:outer membrane autotransporter protein|nr:autotransporter outer membrane beta-barrel domain-containing protein [Opitutaceae bacterium]
MTTLHSPKIAKLLGCVLISAIALTAHANEWIITGAGTNAPAAAGRWIGPEWGVTGSYASLQDGDTFIFTTDVWTDANNPFNPGAANRRSLTFKSDDPDQWRIIGNTGTLGNTRPFQFQQGTYTLTFDHIIIAGGTLPPADSHGAGILFAASSGGTVSLAGSLILQDNVSAGTGAHTGGAINFAAQANSFLSVSASISFLRNVTANQGGGVNIGNSNLGAEFTGVTLFESNTASNSNNAAQGNGGAYFSANAASVSTFSNTAIFKNNYARNSGGAISTNATGAASPQLILSGNSYFEGNQTGDGTLLGHGGAIYWNGNLDIVGSSTFKNNFATNLGGAIYLSSTSGHQASITLDASNGDITFTGNQQNTRPDEIPEANAIVMQTVAAQTFVPVLTLNSGSIVGNHAIYFFDPISVTDTTAAALVNVTGSNVVVFDTYTSMVTATTNVASGALALTRGAIYGSGADAGTFTVETGAKLSANGAVRANTITLADGSQLDVNGGGSITLEATNLVTGANLILSGHGAIDIAKALDVALIDIGTLISGDPTLSATGTNYAQILTLGSSMPVSLADGGIIAIDLFDDGSNDLLRIDTTTFSLSGTVGYINLIGTGNGEYKVLSSTTDLTAVTDDLKPLVNGNAPAGHFGALKDYRENNTELWFQFSTINLFTTWTGTAPEGAIWIGSAGGAPNWDNSDAVSPDYTFLNGDSVLFDDTATVKTIIIHADGVAAADMTVDNSAGNDYTFAGTGGITASATISLGSAITPAGKLTKTGDGALDFTNTGTNTFENGIEVSGGTLGFTAAAQLGDGGNGIRFAGDATLRANAANITLANTLKIDAAKTATIDTTANTLAYSGLLAADTTGTLAKTGAGVLKLTADNSASTAATHIREGTLALDGATAQLGGRIDIDGGAILGGNGIATGDVYAAANALIHPGAISASTPVTLTVNNLTLDSSILRFNLFASGTNDSINITGLLTANGSNTIDISAFQAGSFNLGNLAALDGVNVTIGGFAQPAGARQKATVTGSSNGDLYLSTEADMSRIVTWTGAISGTWIPTDANWTDSEAVTLYANGDRVIFDDTAPDTSPRDITIAGGGVTVSDVLVQGTSNHAFFGAGITADPASVISGTVITTGSGKLIKDGSGTLAFNNAANNFLGGIEIDGGAITFTDANQLGAGANGITFTGDAGLVSLTDAQTLANNITIAGGKTVTLDAGAHDITLSGSLAATNASTPGTLVKIGAGTLALTGNGADAANLVASINEGSLFLGNTLFAGAIDMAADTTMTATGTVGAARIATNATLHTNNGTLNIADLHLAASSTLTGVGSLAGLATLHGIVHVDVTGSAGALTLNGVIQGDGGFLKAGSGTLAYDSVSALGNTGPLQIDEGVVNLHGVSGTASGMIRQTIVLNSGTLRLNNTISQTVGTENTAIDWTGITFVQGTGTNASVSRIIGGTNDIIRIGSGTYDFDIRNGLHVVVDAGDGTTVFTSTYNNYAGVLRIDSGTFQATAPWAVGSFGTGATAKVVLNGGILQLSSTMTTTRGIALRAAEGIVTVDDGISATWGGITKTVASATAAFIKTGAGTLTITGSSTANSLLVAEGRYTARQSTGAGAGGVTVADGAVFEFAATAAGSGNAPNIFRGPGTLAVSSGTVAFTANRSEIAHINVSGPTAVFQIAGNSTAVDYTQSTFTVDNGSHLRLASSGQTLGNVTLDGGATLGFAMASGTSTGGFKKATIAGLSGSGTLAFNTNMALGWADSLTISATPDGIFDIAVKNYGALPETYYAPITLITAPDAGTATFNTPGAIDVGFYKYAVITQTSGGNVSVIITGTGAMSNSASVINAMAGALPLSWFSEINSVTQRMGELHMETRDKKAGLSAWMRAYGQDLNFNSKVTGTPFDERQYAVEGGADYKFGGTKYNIYFGGFFGYGQTDRDYDIAGDGSGESIFGGIYGTVSSPNGWYVDLVTKLNGFKNKFTAVSPTSETMTATYNNWAIGGSLEFGKYCDVGYGWYLEPQIQGAATIIAPQDYVTSSGIQVDLRYNTTAHTRIGFTFGRVIETGANGILNVYVKGYGASQWTIDGQIHVVTPNGETKRYTPVIKGDRLEVGGGIAWRATGRTQYYFDFETATADYYKKPWGVNFGIRHSW